MANSLCGWHCYTEPCNNTEVFGCVVCIVERFYLCTRATLILRCSATIRVQNFVPLIFGFSVKFIREFSGQHVHMQ